jgi:VRR-NUC domain
MAASRRAIFWCEQCGLHFATIEEIQNTCRADSAGNGVHELHATQSEASFQQQVYDAARALGWHAYHTWDSRHSAAGFPDLVLVRRPWLIVAELKRDGEHPSAAQQVWLDELAACGIETHVWHPADWPAIERRLL